MPPSHLPAFLPVLAALFLPLLPAAGRPPVERPNLVYIMADDLGWADVGYNGADFLVKQLQAWQQETGAVIPTELNPDFDPGAQSGKKGKRPFTVRRYRR